MEPREEALDIIRFHASVVADAEGIVREAMRRRDDAIGRARTLETRPTIKQIAEAVGVSEIRVKQIIAEQKGET